MFDFIARYNPLKKTSMQRKLEEMEIQIKTKENDNAHLEATIKTKANRIKTNAEQIEKTAEEVLSSYQLYKRGN